MSLAPTYSPEPGPNERRLSITAQSASSLAGFSTLIRRGSGIDIALYNQREDARRATYGRGASVIGEVSLSSTQGIASVQITLEGKVEMTLDTMTRAYPKVLHMSSALWDAARTYSCPSILPFTFVIPESFIDPKTGSTYPLPPSYDTALSLSDLHICCVYKLSVVAVRSRWTTDRTLSVDVEYAPRSLPSRTIMDTPFPFFHTVKTAPEEWRQMSAMLSPQARSTVRPVHCDFFSPSVRVFSKRDFVPFFLQLRGISSSITTLYGSGTQRHDGGWSQRLRRVAQNTQTAPHITVSIQRQIVVNDGTGARIARSYTIGNGSLRSVPPGYTPPDVSEVDEVTVDYEGEIRFIPDLSVGSFDMGILRVLDFIVLSIEPSDSARNYFDNVKQAEGVRVVTG